MTFSRYVIAWRLCTTMRADDVTKTLEQALITSGLDTANVRHRPQLLSDKGSSYIANDLAAWMDDHQMTHVRGAPYHPMTQGKIERWHQTLKKRSYAIFLVSREISNLALVDFVGTSLCQASDRPFWTDTR